MRILAALLLVATSAVLVLAQDRAAKQPFTIAISPVNATVKAGADVWIKVQLTNTSKQDLDTSANISDLTGLDPNFVPQVRDSRGHLAPKRVYPHPELAGGHPVLDRILRPGENLAEEQNVSRLYDMTRPGEYVIQVSRDVPKELGKGTVKSNTITITVTK